MILVLGNDNVIPLTAIRPWQGGEPYAVCKSNELNCGLLCLGYFMPEEIGLGRCSSEIGFDLRIVRRKEGGREGKREETGHCGSNGYLRVATQGKRERKRSGTHSTV